MSIQSETQSRCQRLIQVINEVRARAEQYGVKVEHEQRGLTTNIRFHIPLRSRGLMKTRVEVTPPRVYISRGEFLIDYLPPNNVVVMITDEDGYPIEEYVFPSAMFTATIEDGEVTVEIHYNDCEWFKP